MTRRVTRALLTALAVTVVAPLPGAAATDPGQPPKLDVAAAIRALSSQQVHRAPGAVAVYDESQVRAALTPDMRLLVEPYTGEFRKGGNYATPDQYETEVDQPLRDWAEQNHLKLVEVTGLDVSAPGEGGYEPGTIPELRRQTAYQDVTTPLLGMIDYLKTGKEHYTGPPGDPIVPPSPAQLAALTADLRANPVYNSPDRPDPISVPTSLVTRKTGFTVRVAAFPALRPGRPLVDYAPALAKEFPADDVFVVYGQWMDVAGPQAQVLESARDYAYGRYLNSTLEQGADMADRIGTILLRAYDLITKHPFGRPQPAPFDLQHRISAIAPWVLLGCAVLLGGGSLLAWRRRRADAVRAEKIALRRESALATAAIAELGAKLLAAGPGRDTSAAAERQATATTLFDQATTADGMRRVRHIAEQGEQVLAR